MKDFDQNVNWHEIQKYAWLYFQHLDLNAQVIQNARITLHVFKKSVKILATLIHVVEMPNARPKIIVQYVFAFLDM